MQVLQGLTEQKEERGKESYDKETGALLTEIQEILLQRNENAFVFVALMQGLIENVPGTTAITLQESRIILGPQARNDTEKYLPPRSIHSATALNHRGANLPPSFSYRKILLLCLTPNKHHTAAH